MARWILLLFVVWCAPLTAVQAANPVFNVEENGTSTAWIVRYEKAPEQGNKRRDIAVQLQLLAKPGSDEEFTGTLLRYDKVVKVNVGGQMKELYTIRDGAMGKLSISGTATSPGVGSSKIRRPLRFKAVGSYIENGKIHLVDIRGTYHAGKDGRQLPKTDAEYAKARADDRLVIVLKDKLIKAKTDDAGTGAASKSGDELNAQSIVEETTYQFVLFQAPQDPCDEEPDVDILAEEPYVENPPYEPVLIP